MPENKFSTLDAEISERLFAVITLCQEMRGHLGRIQQLRVMLEGLQLEMDVVIEPPAPPERGAEPLPR